MKKILIAISTAWLVLAGSALLLIRDSPQPTPSEPSVPVLAAPDLCQASKGKGKRKAVDCFDPCTRLVCDAPDPTCMTCRCEPIPGCEP